MKMQDAMDLIHNKPKGYMVDFDWIKGGGLLSDHFPDKHAGEPLIPTEHEAWELADQFARVTVGKTCNIRVVGHDFCPVPGYKSREIRSRVSEVRK